MPVIYGESIPIVKTVRKRVCLSTSIQIFVRGISIDILFGSTVRNEILK